MVRFVSILSLFGCAATLVTAHDDMDMDMDMDMDIDTTTSQSIDVSPTASIVPCHMNQNICMAFLYCNRPRLPLRERLYWENYNTTTYFTTQAGNRSALRYHIITLLLVAFVLYPVSLALSAARSRWYLPLLFVNLCICISSVMALSVFKNTFPEEDWYAHNIYGTTSVLLLVFMLVHFFAAVLSVPVSLASKKDCRPVDTIL
nr:AAC_HP1_G0006600.mRNA.1.CDS.1 [Saccharomyces cerevisiae]